MFKRVLIANRGEIAVRIIRACHELGIKAVAIYSEADKDSLHVRLADEAYCIGKCSPKDTYLNINNILNIAIHSKADAVHPGYGFLSESSFFAKSCEKFSIRFIGPNYDVIDKLGEKSNAKDTMKKAHVPIVPGSDGEIDCTIQRRHQKLVEESPSPALDDKMREAMGKAAVNASKAVGYNSVGTVEFLLNEEGNDFYFMEMNTRIQVEHGVTEMVTGIDLIKEQILAACGNELSFKQEDIKINGCAIECRINAENPDKDFMPSPGKIKEYIAPGGIGIRIDSACYSGYYISPFYDSMISKVVAWGRDRDEAILRMKRALNEFIIEGVETTIPFHKSLMDNDVFKRGEFNTKFLELNKLL